MMYTTGIDVSKWQGVMDWAKAAAAGARFAVARATVGDYYTDETFLRNITGARAAGLLVGAYHVVAPEKSAGAQIDLFLDTVRKAGPLDFPLVLDCEMVRGQTPKVITACIEQCADRLRGLGGHAYPIIYTAAGFWNSYVLRSRKWAQYPLWVANYTAAAQPWLPLDWKSFVIWQWSADGNGKGATFGAQSEAIDLNRFAGTEMELLGWLGKGKPEPEPEPAPLGWKESIDTWARSMGYNGPRP